MPKRARADYGPLERIERGEVRIVEAAVPHGRAVQLVDGMPPRLQAVAARLLLDFDYGQFSGHTLLRLDTAGGGNGRKGENLTDKAVAARKRLAAAERALGPLAFAAIWHMLFFGESQQAFAMRARNMGLMIDRKGSRAALVVALDVAAAFFEGHQDVFIISNKRGRQ